MIFLWPSNKVAHNFTATVPQTRRKERKKEKEDRVTTSSGGEIELVPGDRMTSSLRQQPHYFLHSAHIIDCFRDGARAQEYIADLQSSALNAKGTND